MKQIRRDVVTIRIASVAVAASIILAAGAHAALAQNFPSKQPIRMIVPISPGSVTDVTARMTAQVLQEKLGQNVIVVNRPGANMVIGGLECAKAPPDGYTLCVVSPDTMSFNPYTVPNLGYDPERDFRPIMDMYHVIEGLIVKKDLPVNSVEELRALAVKEPGKLNFGTLGERTTTDAFRRWLGEQWKTNFVGIPYKGGSEIIQALLAGTIDVAKIGVGNMAGQLQEGKLKILAQRSSKRSPLLQNVPTFGEAGLGEFPGGPIFWGLVVPAGTPDAVVKRLHDEMLPIFTGAKFGDFAQKQFLEPAAGSTADFVTFLKKDRADAGKLVKDYMQN
jgi:tripartite-type tricarboxylate transporter receptor subunit TctC